MRASIETWWPVLLVVAGALFIFAVGIAFLVHELQERDREQRRAARDRERMQRRLQEHDRPRRKR